jgi:CubicO group peptidase (beta-lactamase class C family)
MTMTGFPPSVADRWSLANWQNAPVNRWSFRHMREVVPTARVGRGAFAPNPLPASDGFDAHQIVGRRGGSSASVAEVIADSYTDGLLVLQDGRVVTEQYFSPMTAEQTHMMMSMSKSVVGCVAGVLADRGMLDPQAPVTTYVPELEHSGYLGASVRDVLDMRTGIAFSEEYLNSDAEVRLLEQVIGWAPRTRPDLPSSMYEFLTTLVADREHGGRFEYRSCETDVLGWICERASGVRMPDLISTLLWSRIGAEQDMDAAVDPAGAVFHDGGLAATLRDLGRFGQLLLADGVTESGDQVVPRWWIRDSYAGGPGTRQAFLDSGNDSWLPGGMYRNQFWVPRPKVLLCLGIHGQLIWVEPERRLVVVKLSSWPTPQNVDLLLDTLAAIDMIGSQLTLR